MQILTKYYNKYTFLFVQQTLTCNECGAKKKSQKQMEKHLLVHKIKKILKCRVCSKICDDRIHLKEHKDIHRVGGSITVVVKN